jgi:DNA-binding transcriptional MerR regulator
MPDASEEVLAFPDTQARRLAGVSMRRLRYWEQVGLIVPLIKRRLTEHKTVRLYSYQDLLALLVVSALRTERDMSLQTIRRVVRHLRSRGYDEPLRELRFATVGHEIYFQHPDGTWEGDLQPDQIILEKVIRLDPLRLRIDKAAGARPTTRAEWRSAGACTPALQCSPAPGSGSQRYRGICSRGTKLTRSSRHFRTSRWRTSTKPGGNSPKPASAIPA